MLKKIVKRKVILDKIERAYGFKHALEFTHQALEAEKTKEDKILILDFMLDVIKRDLKYDFLTDIFYREEYFDRGRKIRLPFPYSYYDETEQKISIFERKIGTKKVDLSEECVLVFPWHRKRIRENIKNIGSKEFIYDKYNHFAYYFSPVGICFVYNGMHSTTAGIGFKKGFIEASEYDMTGPLGHVYTDGLYWYNSHNNLKLKDGLLDFRIGIIFELLKLKYQIEEGLK